MKKFLELFKIGGEEERVSSSIIQFLGLFLLLLLWLVVTEFGNVSVAIFPSPLKVFGSFKELHFEDELVLNAFYSIKLNFIGYLKAVGVCIPLGFLIGLFPFFRSLLSKYVDAIRFIPLTAVTGLFVGWFGIYDEMKINFLAFGIIVYLLPIMIQRVMGTEKVHVQSIWTLGANTWQMFRHVYFPSAISKVFDDIRVIVAISWTYIIVAEMVNKQGGVGDLIFRCARNSRVDKVFAVLIVIIIIGFLQDMLFKWADRKLFPHKHA